MPVAGFSFNKINLEKTKSPSGQVNIKNNISITNVEKDTFPFGKAKDDAVKFTFAFKSDYEPGVANMDFEGTVLYMSDTKEAKSILDEWTKSKKIKPEISVQILNTALTKCNIIAINMSQELGLPSPIPLPKIDLDKRNNSDKSYIG